MLTLKKTDKRAAFIKLGAYNGKIIYIKKDHSLDEPTLEDTNYIDDYESDDEFDTIPPDNPLALIPNKFYGRKKEMKKNKIKFLQHALLSKKPPDDPFLTRLYKQAKSIIDNKAKTSIDVWDGFLFPMPSETPEHGYASGATGGGKSFFIGEYIKLYKKTHFSHNKVYLFSIENEIDPTLKGVKGIIRIKLDEELVDDPIDPLKEMSNSLVIFDDIDMVKDKEVLKAVKQIQGNILQNGRKHGIYSLSTSHIVCNYASTRQILADCQFIVLFPGAGMIKHINYCLEKYVGLDKTQQNHVLNLHSRWIYIKLSVPRYVISQHSIYLL